MRGRQVPCARATAHSTVGPSARVHRKCREPPLWRCTPVFSVYSSSARGERRIPPRFRRASAAPPRFRRRAARPRVAPAASRFLRLLCGLALFVCGTAHTNDANPHKSVGSGRAGPKRGPSGAEWCERRRARGGRGARQRAPPRVRPCGGAQHSRASSGPLICGRGVRSAARPAQSAAHHRYRAPRCRAANDPQSR